MVSIRHNIRIRVAKRPKQSGIFASQPFRFLLPFWQRWFRHSRVLILVPGDNVDSVTITEVADDDAE